MHMKRQKIEKSWPISRKGTKYVVISSHEKSKGIPILIIIRDIMKLAKNRKEVKKILNQKTVSLNGKTVIKDNLSVLPFDILKIRDKKYEVVFSEKGKFSVKETRRDESILKVISKKILKGKKIQLNLIYGKNIISEENVPVGSSVVIKDKKIIKIIPLEVGRDVAVISGKYKGREGEIKSINDKIATLSSNKEEINVPIKNIMAVK